MQSQHKNHLAIRSWINIDRTTADSTCWGYRWYSIRQVGLQVLSYIIHIIMTYATDMHGLTRLCSVGDMWHVRRMLT